MQNTIAVKKAYIQQTKEVAEQTIAGMQVCMQAVLHCMSTPSFENTIIGKASEKGH